MSNPWDNHYTRARSVLVYPDENLVRMLMKFADSKTAAGLSAVDLGCGTGRHIKMLSDVEVSNIFGTDNSINALKICRDLYNFPFILCDNLNLPFNEYSFDIVVSWGSLHYCEKNFLQKQIDEIYRIMKKGGRLFGTLRSERDTYLKKGKQSGNDIWITDLKDIKNSTVSFYSEKELMSAFNIFADFQYGIIERTIIGDIEKRISHWVFWAEK
jgi:ubiquinone/menaquinone biosynthesis C-methylase UbiE